MQDSEEMEQEGTDDMLQTIPKPLRTDAYKLIPSSEWLTCTCCIIYDQHPMDRRKLDITICLQGGKVLEIYQRVPVSYIKVPNVSKFKEIRILRNNKAELYYLVATEDKLFILSSKDKLELHRTYTGVIYYDICDPTYSGEPKLMIRSTLSSIFVSFINNYEIVDQASRNVEPIRPVICELSKKLTEAKYNLRSNEKAVRQLERLRQHASFLHKEEVELIAAEPIITFCNKRIVIQTEIENPYDQSIEKVCVLIHNSSCNSISYTNKVFKHLPTSPFYLESDDKEIKSKCKASVAAVIPIREFKNSIRNRIEFSIVVSYMKEDKEYLKSFDNINISAAEMMGNNFDVFNNPEIDVRNICMAMLSTTVKTILCIKQKGLEGDMIEPSRIFCKYLKMNVLGELSNVVVHRHSPHHILHGMLIVFDDDHNNYIDVENTEFNFKIYVYSRSISQVQALIHFIYDIVPLKLIITTPNISLIPNEDSDSKADNSFNFDYTQCADSLMKQSSMTLKYLDDCLKEMNKTSDKFKKSDIQIDLFAMGHEKFVKYRDNMIMEAECGIQDLVKSDSQMSDTEVMEVDET